MVDLLDFHVRGVSTLVTGGHEAPILPDPFSCCNPAGDLLLHDPRRRPSRQDPERLRDQLGESNLPALEHDPSDCIVLERAASDPAWIRVDQIGPRVVAYRIVRDATHEAAWHMQPFAGHQPLRSTPARIGARSSAAAIAERVFRSARS
jgi:hypothetical protein